MDAMSAFPRSRVCSRMLDGRERAVVENERIPGLSTFTIH